MDDWRPIATAVPLDRIIVAGWQEQRGKVAAYWWLHEDFTDDKGVPMDHPDALLWQPFPERPTSPPTQLAGE
jgi:hypothetical protein